ncbi:hypothetical protein [Pseudobacteroides cellulosolvens]|uniref:Uncharacterized protein n=1 Tax=Pseudobacteroides cellulosolvens ATCC 35603 = DSM 2933 TaxID=398512 RepID=A0A0L6JRS1_9FIRM|nr:hypothetical protein [Pseudobacteroides cellulosolvens]KNY28483.1 hypothetical protein Bccel_3757 [Pseudobacteroides cellulosolvens ATCC 35603 = DSM 2933]
MFIIYKNNLYHVLDEKSHLVIITRQKSKADEDFLSTKESFYKEISKDDKYIQDVYTVQFFLKWDSHLDGVDKTWEILTEHEYLKENQVLLKFVNGILPGWEVEEQAVCSKYVDIDECEDFLVVYTYTVKDGDVLKIPMVLEQKVSREDFQKLVLKYQIKNI